MNNKNGGVSIKLQKNYLSPIYCPLFFTDLSFYFLYRKNPQVAVLCNNEVKLFVQRLLTTSTY